MKKVLSTALILGALYGTANAATVTSPIYMPEAGKILSTINVGYTTSEFDKAPSFADGYRYTKDLRESWNIGAEGKFGITDRLSLNYGVNFDFARKIAKNDESAKFTDYYIGLTGRVVDADAHKFDIILNVGQEEAPVFYNVEQPYVDLALRYGLDLDMYNLGFSIGGRYINDYETELVSYGKSKLERGFDFYLKLENEFIFDRITVGLDLFYTMHDDLKSRNLVFDNEFKWDSYNEYGFNVDVNYALTEDNYIGVYFDMTFSDLKNKTTLIDGEQTSDHWKDPTEYSFGIKYTTQF